MWLERCHARHPPLAPYTWRRAEFRFRGCEGDRSGSETAARVTRKPAAGEIDRAVESGSGAGTHVDVAGTASSYRQRAGIDGQGEIGDLELHGSGSAGIEVSVSGIVGGVGVGAERELGSVNAKRSGRGRVQRRGRRRAGAGLELYGSGRHALKGRNDAREDADGLADDRN